MMIDPKLPTPVIPKQLLAKSGENGYRISEGPPKELTVPVTPPAPASEDIIVLPNPQFFNAHGIVTRIWRDVEGEDCFTWTCEDLADARKGAVLIADHAERGLYYGGPPVGRRVQADAFTPSAPGAAQVLGIGSRNEVAAMMIWDFVEYGADHYAREEYLFGGGVIRRV